MDLKAQEWESSYRNRDNFVFYPHEEVIRFTSKYIRKKIGFDEYIDVHRCKANPRVLDLGCGIGRHVSFLHKYGLDVWGIDLSSIAINAAKDLFIKEGMPCLADKLVLGSITKMPFSDSFFDFIVCHGVLDSVPFNIAKEAMKEANRCLRNNGLFYLDLISGDDSCHYPEFCGEEIVDSSHECGTVQSYFNEEKIRAMIGGYCDILEGVVIRKKSLSCEFFHSRYHLVLRNKITF